MLQVSGNSGVRRGDGGSATGSRQGRRLAEVPPGETAVLDILDLPEDTARRLMELGFVPGHAVTPSHSAPGGDPRVFRVDGSEIALRRDTTAKMWVRPPALTAN